MKTYHFLTNDNKVDMAIVKALRKTHVHHAGTLAQVTKYKLSTIKRKLKVLIDRGIVIEDSPFLYIGVEL